MRVENLHEYELIRREILDLKKCMTDYISYMLGGSGVAIFGLALVTRDKISEKTLFYVPVGLCVVLHLLLYFLYYKFASHNRMAGYCRVLSEEQWRTDRQHPAWLQHVALWEQCVLAERQDAVVSRERPAHWSVFKGGWDGLQTLRRFLLRRNESLSWMFPMWVTVSFMVVTVTFNFVCLHQACALLYPQYCATTAEPKLGSDEWIRLAWATGVALLIELVVWWTYFLVNLDRLMNGRSSVRSYAAQFRVARRTILGRMGVMAYHDSLEAPDYLRVPATPARRRFSFAGFRSWWSPPASEGG